MKFNTRISVAFVRPPISGHLERGTGTYYNNLFKFLSLDDRIEIYEVGSGDPVAGADIIHYPYFDPFFITMPLLGKSGKTKQVVTVHDLIPLKFPDRFPKGLRGLLKWGIQSGSLSRSDMIVTDSQVSKNDIKDIVKIKEDKISVIPLGVGENFRKIKVRGLLTKTVTGLKLPEKFILHIGDVNYNKNIPGLISAYSALSGEFKDMHLVLAGRGFATPSPQLDRIIGLINESGLEYKVHRLAGLSEDELVALYNLALVYVQPSFYEGFGLPVLEAFACGTPVVSSRGGSLPEIAGGAALMIDPKSPANLAASIKRMLTDDKLKKKLIVKGSERVQKYTWQKTAAETINLYRKVLGIKDYLS